MVKPTESKALARPLKKENEGKFVTLKPVKIILAGHVSSVIQIGPLHVRIGNLALREAVGDPDL